MDKKYDVIIVGTGAAGLYAALNFPKDISVLLVSKRDLPLSLFGRCLVTPFTITTTINALIRQVQKQPLSR